MKRFLAFLLVSLCVASAYPNNTLRFISGTLISLQGHTLILEQAPNIEVRVKTSPLLEIASADGKYYPASWLFPGDAITVHLNRFQQVDRINVFPEWVFGTVSFSTTNRITLLEGFQAPINNAPVSLNGNPIQDAASLKPPQEVVIRINHRQNQLSGIWAFDFHEPPQNPLQGSVKLVTSIPGGGLHVEAHTDSGRIVTAQLIGVTQKITLRERRKRVYRGVIEIPPGVAVPRSYVMVESQGIQTLLRTPISIYTIPSQVTELVPLDGSNARNNPPLVYVAFDPSRAPLEPESIRFFVDRHEVTNNTFRNNYLVFFLPKTLAHGWHSCYLWGKIVGGAQIVRKRWEFRVR